jgi:magnesium chelatase family protein
MGPGEASLAHNGVLFLDEAPEFGRSVLQALREPVEEGRVRISRAGASALFPADFQLVLAANPCPCGKLGKRSGSCLCSLADIERYWGVIGEPLLDRLDIRVSVSAERGDPPAAAGDLRSRPDPYEEAFSGIEDVAACRAALRLCDEIKRERAARVRVFKNARIRPEDLAESCPCSSLARELLEEGVAKAGHSIRGSHAALRVARTLADLRGEDVIGEAQVRAALALRGMPDSFWSN